MIKPGTIKKVKKKGLEFELQAIDEEFLVIPEDGKKAELKRIGIVLTDLNPNPFGIKKGTKMIMSDDV